MTGPAKGGAATGETMADLPTRREIRAVFLGLMIVLGLGAVDQSIVATALPRIVGDLGGISHLSWVVTAYVLASTSTMPLYGKLSDQYGRKPMITIAILIFLLGSALSGTAQSLIQLIVFRAVQGLGAGGLLPLSQIIIGDLVPPARRGSKQGAIAAVFAVCSVVGPVLGGAITDLLSWHWIFYVNLPIGALALYMIDKALRRPLPTQRRRIDYLGALLLTGCTTAFLFVLARGGSEWPWTSPQIVCLSLGAGFLAVLFVFHIRLVTEPVLPPDLFRNRLFVIACTVMVLTFMGMLGAGLFFPLFFQLVMGTSPTHSGLLTGPLMIGIVISSIVNGRVLLRSGRYKPAQIGGLAVAVAAFSALAWGAATAQGFAVIEPSIFALGLGLGLVMPNMTIAVQNALPATQQGVGVATLAFFRSLGGLIGVTGSGAILSWRLHAAAGPLASAESDVSLADAGVQQIGGLSSAAHLAAVAIYRQAIAMTFVTGACIVAVALVALLFLPELPLRAHHLSVGRPSDADA
jgi:EmrB/QacA subfamily drug resistance transporter